METDLWSRMASKRTQVLQAVAGSTSLFVDRHVNTDDMDVEEEVRTDFACPYCDDEFDIVSLCSHLEEEHCFDGKLSMCPVCAAKLESEDVTGHIAAQHGHLFKIPRRRRFSRSKPKDFPANLQALLGGRSSTSSTDSFLSSLVAVFPSVEDALKTALPFTDEITSAEGPEPEVSVESTLTTEERERRAKQASSRAEFVQQLVLSTLWPES